MANLSDVMSQRSSIHYFSPMRYTTMKCLIMVFMAGAVLTFLTAPTQGASIAGYWNLDENGGSTAADSGPLGKDGTLGGTYAWVPGISGSGVEFTGLMTGTDGWMDCEDVLGNIGMGDLTISLWVKSVKAQNFHILYEHGHTNSPGPGINISNDERAAYAGLRGQVREDATWDQAEEDGYVLDTEWHHIVLGRDGASGKVLLYRDNAKVAEVDSTPMDMDLTGTTITWGNVGDVTSGVYHNFGASAVLDDLQIYTGWVGEGGIDFLYNNPGSVVPEPATVALLVTGLLGFIIVVRRKRK